MKGLLPPSPQGVHSEDHEVEFEVLLWCWIGEGLVPGHVGDDPEIDAYDLLMKLRRRSLIESIANLDDEWDTEWRQGRYWNWKKHVWDPD
jgi:hypothetical protein